VRLTGCKRKRPNLHIIRTVRTGKLWGRVVSYHEYVPSSKNILGDVRGSLVEITTATLSEQGRL